MFWRILSRLLWASRGRLLLALLAVTSGAAVCAALVNLDLDAGEKFTREFRTLGANVIVAPQADQDSTPTMDEAVMMRIAAMSAPEVVAAAPYVYIVANTGQQTAPIPVIVAGTWFDQVARMNSWWKIDGQWMTQRDDEAQCMVGANAARQLGVAPGGHLTLRYLGREAQFAVAGVMTSGDSEDNQIFISLPAAQSLAQLGDRVALAQISVRGATPVLEDFVRRLGVALPDLEVRPVRQLAATEGHLLERIRSLLFVTVVLILVLSAMGVLAATAGLAIERRRDVGLMKAIGGSVRRVMRFFFAEAMVIAVIGGAIGGGLGLLLSRWIGWRVFSAEITPRLIVLPLTIAAMMIVALAGALPLRLLGRVRPAEILRGE
jgi:putative ABC transport system permease protein